MMRRTRDLSVLLENHETQTEDKQREGISVPISCHQVPVLECLCQHNSDIYSNIE